MIVFNSKVNVREEEDENTEGNFNFVPKYPTYNFIEPSAPQQY